MTILQRGDRRIVQINERAQSTAIELYHIIPISYIRYIVPTSEVPLGQTEIADRGRRATSLVFPFRAPSRGSPPRGVVGIPMRRSQRK